MSPTSVALGADRVAERAVEGGGVFRRVGHDLHAAEAGGVERLADRADAPVHHVGGGDHVGAGLRLHERLADELRDARVVDDLVALHDAVMAVARVGIERDVGDEADLRARRALMARQARADEVLGIQRLRAERIAARRLGVGEERDRRDA